MLREAVKAVARCRVRVLLLAAVALLVVVVAVAGSVAGATGAIIALTAAQAAALAAIAVVAAGLRTRLHLLQGELARGRPPVQAAAIPTEMVAVPARLAATLLAQAEAHRADGAPAAALAAAELGFAVAPDHAALARLHAELTAQLALDPSTRTAALAAVDRQLALGDQGQATRLLTRLDRVPDVALARDQRRVAVAAADGDAAAVLDLARELAIGEAAELWGSRRVLHPGADTHRAVTPSDERHLAPADRILISGHFYSGSGAVKDHLAGFSDVLVWPPKDELRTVKFPGGYADLGRRLAAQGELRPADLVDHFLHLTGRRLTGAAPGVYDRWEVVNRTSAWIAEAGWRSRGFRAALLDGFVALVDAAASGELDPAGFEALARDTLARAFDVVAVDNGAARLVVDQVVTAWRLPIARYLPASTLVLVHRDPRDQYVEVRDVMSQPGRRVRASTPEGFIDRQRRVNEVVRSAMDEVTNGFGHRVVRVSFEELVVDHETTLPWLHAQLGFEGRQPESPRFHPEVSRRNVGKHHHLLATDTAAALVAALPEHVSVHADRPSPR